MCSPSLEPVPLCPPPLAAAVEQVWATLAETLGTTATAALIRRAARRASTSAHRLEQFLVEGQGYSYRLQMPEKWAGDETAAQSDVRCLLQELCLLLTDLTGDVITAKLATVPAIQPLLPSHVVQRSSRDVTRI